MKHGTTIMKRKRKMEKIKSHVLYLSQKIIKEILQL